MLKIEYVKSVFKLADIPKGGIPEIILLGRSNVGKSTLINSIFSKADIAKASSTPGKTKSLNYYLCEKKIHLVDLPGLGYAKLSIPERRKIDDLIYGYLNRSRNISYAIHILDANVIGSKYDIQIESVLGQESIPVLVILNKVDKLNLKELDKSKKALFSLFPHLIEGDNLILHSAKTGRGKKEIVSLFNKLFIK